MTQSVAIRVGSETDCGQAVRRYAFWAFRYALGRRTVIVEMVGRELIADRDLLDPNDRGLIVQDIRAAIANGRAGDFMDVVVWQEVAEALAASSDPGASDAGEPTE